MTERKKLRESITAKVMILPLVVCLSSCSATDLASSESPEPQLSDVKVCNALTNFASARSNASDPQTAAEQLGEIADSVAVLVRENISRKLKDTLLDYNQAIRETLLEYEREGKASAEAITKFALVSEDVIEVCSEAVMSDINE